MADSNPPLFDLPMPASNIVRHPAEGHSIPPVVTNPDGTMGGNPSGDGSAGSQGVQDATGSRAA